jgi:hypothetical protein
MNNEDVDDASVLVVLFFRYIDNHWIEWMVPLYHEETQPNSQRLDWRVQQ